MGLSRWVGLLGPSAMTVMAVTLLAVTFPVALAAGPAKPTPNSPIDCPVGRPDSAAISELVTAATADARVSSVALLSPRGEETGRRVVAELAAGRQVAIDLPAESFVAGPFGRALVYGSHDGRGRSEVRLVDLTTGCGRLLAAPDGAVRSAVLDPAGMALYIHTVTHPERRDAGVMRHDLATGAAAVVVDPLPDSERFGPTFATSLVWSASGDELAVQSCGFSLCRTRVQAAGAGELETYAGEGHGALIGLTRQALFTFAACHWSPCDVLTIDRPSGRTTTLLEEAHDATLVRTAGGLVVRAETASGTVEVKP